MTWTGHLHSTTVQLPVVKWLVCMQGELLYQSISLCKKAKVLSENKTVWSELVVDCCGDFGSRNGVRTSVQAMSVLPLRGAPVHTDIHDVAQCLGKKLVWTTKPCAFSFLCWGDYFPTSSGANLISVAADTWLMCIIMQGSTCHRQWKQTSRQFLSPWQRSESLSFSLTQPSKK